MQGDLHAAPVKQCMQADGDQQGVGHISSNILCNADKVVINDAAKLVYLKNTCKGSAAHTTGVLQVFQNSANYQHADQVPSDPYDAAVKLLGSISDLPLFAYRLCPNPDCHVILRGLYAPDRLDP